MTLYTLKLQCAFPKSRSLLLHTDTTVLNSNKFNKDITFTSNFCVPILSSDQKTSLIAFFPSSREFSLGLGIAWSCHVSSVSLKLEYFQSLSLSSMTLSFLKNIVSWHCGIWLPCKIITLSHYLSSFLSFILTYVVRKKHQVLET